MQTFPNPVYPWVPHICGEGCPLCSHQKWPSMRPLFFFFVFFLSGVPGLKEIKFCGTGVDNGRRSPSSYVD